MKAVLYIPHISNLPYDVVDVIFQQMPLGQAACLGLTCRHLYKCLKTTYPQRIRPSTMICEHDTNAEYLAHQPHTYLRNLLGSWMGPQYRLSAFSPYLYLNKDVYGDRMGSRKEVQLAHRYHDYGIMVGMRYVIDDWEPKWPYGLPGEEWHEEVLEQMIKDVRGFDDSKLFKFFWGDTHVYKENQHLVAEELTDLRLWEKWSEGLALMNF